MRHLILCLLVALPWSAQALNVAEGDAAPAVDLPNLPLDGANTSLASLRGKVVYLDFWASWCGPCRLSMPVMNTLRNEYQDQGFEVLAITVDEFQEDALEFLEEFQVDYPIISDVNGVSPSAYGVLGMPTAFLIDREGVVRVIHEGFRKSDVDKIRHHIEQLLEQ